MEEQPAPTLRQRQRQLREESILDAAQELMAQHGYSGMSMDDLAAHVGISKATLYQHFSSKEELAVNVVIRRMRRAEALARRQEQQLPAIEHLKLVMRQMLQERYNQQLPDFSAAHHEISAFARQHQNFHEQVQRINQAFAALIDAAKAEGDIDQQLSTPVLVSALLSSMRDADYAGLLRSGSVTVDQLIETLSTMWFGGIQRTPSQSPNTSGNQ